MKAELHDMIPTPRNNLINLLVLIMVIAFWHVGTVPVASNEPAPQADEALTSELGDQVNVAVYSIRPPKFLIAQKPRNFMGLQQHFGWADAPVSGSGSSTLLMLSICTLVPPIGDVTDEKLPALCRANLIGMNRSNHLDKYACSAPKNRIIDGVTFARSKWSGVTRADPHEEEYGFIFVSVSSSKEIALTGISPSRAKLSIVEAAAMSFHR